MVLHKCARFARLDYIRHFEYEGALTLPFLIRDSLFPCSLICAKDCNVVHVIITPTINYTQGFTVEPTSTFKPMDGGKAGIMNMHSQLAFVFIILLQAFGPDEHFSQHIGDFLYYVIIQGCVVSEGEREQDHERVVYSHSIGLWNYDLHKLRSLRGYGVGVCIHARIVSGEVCDTCHAEGFEHIKLFP